MLSLLVWQESVNATPVSGNPSVLIGNHIALNPGVSFEQEFVKGLSAQIGVGALIGQNDVADPQSKGPLAAYKSTGNTTLGATASFGLFWNVADQKNVRIGFTVPLIYRISSQPEPPADYTLSLGRKALLGGLWLVLDFQSGRWFFSPKVGFLNSFSNFCWSMQLAYKI